MPVFPDLGERFTILEFVGRGGFGAVYRGQDNQMEREVALKILNPEFASDAEWRNRFKREATAASKLVHPNVTIFYDRGEYNNQLYIVMEFVQGQPLSALIQEAVPLPDVDRLILIEQLCDGLHAAHQAQIIHRDIKPINLVIRESRRGSRTVRTLKILDFGIAKVLNAGHTVTGRMLGTPSYLSPEHFLGTDVDYRSDIFAVGAVAYELLVYKKAFPLTSTHQWGQLQEARRRIVDEPHVPMTDVRPELDPELVAVIDRALAKDPLERYQDLGEMLVSLQGIRQRLSTVKPEVLHLVESARYLLDSDDPPAAIERLEQAQATASNDLERQLIEPLLNTARRREVIRIAEQEREQQEAAALEINTATARFMAGNTAGAIGALEIFSPGDLVAAELARFRRAADLIAAADAALQEGSGETRDAALRALQEFSPFELVKDAADRLQARAAEIRAEEEAVKAERGALERFRAGRRREAIETLAAFEPAARVAPMLVRLRAAAHAIDEVIPAIERGDPDERTAALGRLEAFADRDLTDRATTELRVLDQQRRTQEEDHQAEMARQVARAQAEREEREAQALIDAARAEFIGGRRLAALSLLEANRSRDLVVEALDELRQADAEIDRAEAAVAEGDPATRAAALQRLARFAPRELIEPVLEALRSREDDRAREARLASEAAHAMAWARDTFATGRRVAALESLELFQPPALVEEALAGLRLADQAIELARDTVASGDDEARIAAVAALGRFSPHELVAAAEAQLESEHLRRRAADAQARVDQEHRGRAEAITREARDAFSAGEVTDALGLLTNFEPPHPLVTGLLAELRTTMAVRELLGSAELALAAGDLSAAGASIAEARRLRPNDPIVTGVDARIRAERHQALVLRIRRIAVPVVVGLTVLVLALLAGPAVYRWITERRTAPPPVIDQVKPPEPAAAADRDNPVVVQPQPSPPAPAPDPETPPAPAPGETVPTPTPDAPPKPDEVVPPTPSAAEPVATTPDPAVVERSLARRRAAARQQLAGGQTQSAMASLRAILRTKDDDQAARDLLENAPRLGVAFAATAGAREQAIAKGAPQLAGQLFQEGVQQEQSGGREMSQGRFDRAVSQLGAARATFLRAADRAGEASRPATPSPVRPSDSRPAPKPPETATPEAPKPSPPGPTAPGANTAPGGIAAPPKPAQVDEQTAIRLVTSAWQTAWSRRDIDAVLRVQRLSANEANRLRETFTAHRAILMGMTVDRIDLQGSGQANVTTTVARTYIPLTGRQESVTVRYVLRMEKTPTGWVIVDQRQIR